MNTYSVLGAGSRNLPPGLPPSFELISRDTLQKLLWDQGMTDADVAHLYGISANQVHRKRVQMNLVHGQVTSEQLSEMVRMAEIIKTLPPEAIAEIRPIIERYTQQ